MYLVINKEYQKSLIKYIKQEYYILSNNKVLFQNVIKNAFIISFAKTFKDNALHEMQS